MANTCTLISSVNIASTTSSFTFSSIPSTYTDLLIKWSAKGADADGDLNVKLNSITTNYSNVELTCDVSAVRTGTSTGNSYWNYVEGATYGAAYWGTYTFSYGEMYIPNYAGSTAKIANGFTVITKDTTDARFSSRSNLQTSTAAISSITFTIGYIGIAANSNFYLYGISKS